MTLAAHVVTGAFLGAAAAHNPALGALSGFMSHFLLDAIPHWDYPLSSMDTDHENLLNSTIRLNKSFVFDLMKVGADMVIGFGLIFLVFASAPRSVLIGAFIGACAAIAPDFLQFVYLRFPRQPLTALQWFHAVFMHAKTSLNKRPVIGISLQLIYIILVIFLSWRIFV